jgi:hypothetical protein
MQPIQLNRRFFEWREGLSVATAYGWRLGLSGDLLSWSDLLTRRRVVILAEAGSGKSVELEYQVQQLSAAGKFAFHATVQDVARNGLDGALRASDQQRLRAWRLASEPGWFFIDSVDEAKLDNIRLDKALRQLAGGIVGHEGRAFVVLSGRHTDWEFARDARRLQDELPIPADEPVDPPSFRNLIRWLLNYEKRPVATPQETPLIVLMAALDDDRMRLYASSKGVEDVDEFLAALRSGNLQEIARRPLDLDWLTRYWRSHGHLGTFAAIVEASLRERLSEPDPDRSRQDRLSPEAAMQWLERIGASLVFGRKATIAIPDADAPAPTDQDVLTIDSVLSDRSSSERQLLLSRPAFDPATFGRARLHNDNEGVVRAYLTARWLRRLRGANLSERRLHDLLFTQSYGIELARPSVLETAAWLCIWDESVAREVVRRAPFALFTAGDPSSLPATVRAAAVQALAARMREGEEVPSLDLSTLTRFAQADIVPTLRNLWESDASHAAIRVFVLRLIWLGALRDCADLAASAAYGQYEDRSTLIVAGRAVIATADLGQKQAYAGHIMRNSATLPSSVLWDAVEDLFPTEVGVDDLIAICGVVSLRNETGSGFNIEWDGARLARKLSDPLALTRLIYGLMEIGGGELAQFENVDTETRRTFLPFLAAAAERLLEVSRPDTTPDAAIDAVLYVGDRRLDRTGRHGGVTQVAIARLHESAVRRRAAFWRAAERLSTSATLNGRALQTIFQMEFLGWPPGLVLDDLEWLLADGPSRNLADEQRLATNAALDLWERAGRPGPVLARIEAALAASPAMLDLVGHRLQPAPKSAELLRSEAELEAAVAENEKHRAEVEQSWVDLIESIRNEAEPLSNVVQTSSQGVDGRLYNLWQLLREANRGRSHYVIGSVAPLSELVGPRAAETFAISTRQMWRAWQPTLRSSRPPGERNQIADFDCMGVAAVSLEAAGVPSWATRLTEEEAVRAGEYATLEINGLPGWIADLANVWPAAVQRVLLTEVISDLNDPEVNAYLPSLDYIDHADDDVTGLMAAPIWHEVESRDDLSLRALRPMLSIAWKGLAKDRHRPTLEIAIARFHAATDPRTAALYLGFACAIDGQVATDALLAKLDRLAEAGQTALVLQVLPQIFQSRFSLIPGSTVSLDLATLERLVVLAYRTVRVEDDHDRTNGGVYSPDERDEAQDARSAAFKQLVETPGRQAFDAILRLLDLPGFPVSPSRLLALAHERAATDSELTAWAGEDALRFEQRFERAPTTGRELQLLAIQRIEDLQHDLLHGDFAQGATLSNLPHEPAVQAWIADRMRLSQGNSYSVEREPETVGAKKPDMVFTARAADAKVPVEIKIAESWSVGELEDALERQLCGQYLRARDCREGLMIVVHQRARPKGWALPDGQFLSFVELVQRLRGLTAQILHRSPDGPQPELTVIDVSSCDAGKPKRRNNSARKAAKPLSKPSRIETK